MKSPISIVDVDRPESWTRYKAGMCDTCAANCCTMPVEVKMADLIRLNLVDPFEAEHEEPKQIAKRLSKAGLIDLCVYSGIHSIGTSEFEPPILTSVSDFVLPNNSFISIDVPLFMADWGGFRVETGYQVSEKGVTRFSKTPPAYIEK